MLGREDDEHIFFVILGCTEDDFTNLNDVLYSRLGDAIYHDGSDEIVYFFHTLQMFYKK